MAEEKILTINLRKKVVEKPMWKRSKELMKIFRTDLKKKFKSDRIKFGKGFNEKIWKSGAENPPKKFRIRLTKKDDGSIEVSLME